MSSQQKLPERRSAYELHSVAGTRLEALPLLPDGSHDVAGHELCSEMLAVARWKIEHLNRKPVHERVAAFARESLARLLGRGK